ncbi:MAG TPA: tRNA pseudouridine(38-40) synthase TruA [Myxococcales bacterium]|nr:tRNA pseudouridine(38-40) synthase TruA [Myxococcales bacterium]
MKSAPLAIWLWYRGGAFRGFQRQPKGRTVQGRLEEALAAAGVGAAPHPAGRTDRGVHARMQVVSLRTGGASGQRPDLAERLADAIHRAAPGELGAAACRRAHPSFHAQWSACGKEYRYRFALGEVPQRWRPFCWLPAAHPRLSSLPPPRPERVAELLRLAEGERDFWAFHEKSSPRKPRRLHATGLAELSPGLFEARLRGDSFGRYQVRYLLGGAVAAACGALAVADWEDALGSAREVPGLKAPPEGLVLWSVEYPAALDPFTPQERAHPGGLPAEPPFADPGL